MNEYIVIQPKNNINREDMIPLSQIDKIKQAIWDSYDDYDELLFSKYNEDFTEDAEIIAEEVYNEIFDLEDLEDIFEYLDDNKIKHMIIEEYWNTGI